MTPLVLNVTKNTLVPSGLRIYKYFNYFKKTPWIQRGSRGNFPVTIGSYNGAETWELAGIYMLSILAERINKKDTGLYRDDGLEKLQRTKNRQN